MKAFYKAANSDSVKPAEVDRESSQSVVYVRRNFKLVPASTTEGSENPEHWEYEEAQMSPAEAELYLDNVALRDYIDMIS